MSRLAPVRRRWWALPAAMGCLAVIIGSGAWSVMEPEISVIGKTVGIFCLIFFGLGGVLFLRRLLAGQQLYIGDAGFGFGTRGKAPKIIPWSNVDGISTYEVAGQVSIVIALRDCHAHLAQLSEAEVRGELAKLKLLVGLAKAVSPLANAETGRELDKINAYSKPMRSLLDIWAFHRATYGGELFLSWFDVDRPQKAFVEHMTKLWKSNRDTQSSEQGT